MALSLASPSTEAQAFGKAGEELQTDAAAFQRHIHPSYCYLLSMNLILKRYVPKKANVCDLC